MLARKYIFISARLCRGCIRNGDERDKRDPLGSAYISPDVHVNGEQYRSVKAKRLSGHRQLFPKDPNSISTSSAMCVTFYRSSDTSVYT